MNLLETTKLVKTYGGRTVVNEVSFVIGQEQIVGLLGRNGAGKTTTFRMILGMIVPDSGAVAFDGYDITHLPMYKRARRGIGYLSQERSDFRRLTVWQNLQAILETLNLSRAERNKRANRLLDQYGLMKVRNQWADTLSGGERRKLDFLDLIARLSQLPRGALPAHLPLGWHRPNLCQNGRGVKTSLGQLRDRHDEADHHEYDDQRLDDQPEAGKLHTAEASWALVTIR